MPKKITKDEFIEKSRKIHGNKFDYSKTEYKNARSKVIITCHKHGDISITVDNHLYRSQGCDECAREKHKLVLISKERLSKLKKIHKNKYLYNDISVSKGRINIECLSHGTFSQSIYNHEYGHGCPQCNSSSRGEDKIKEFLESNNIRYSRNHQFEECKREKKLRFDFYLPDLNTIIEYDGEHHFKENKYFGEGNLEYVTKNDKIKNEFCQISRINLIRIPFTQFKNIDTILQKSNFVNFI